MSFWRLSSGVGGPDRLLLWMFRVSSSERALIELGSVPVSLLSHHSERYVKFAQSSTAAGMVPVSTTG